MNPNQDQYDALIIGGGMSGLAAGIRMAMFDKKVAILEQHSILGGLNSFYQRGNYKLDVGLHALTNYSSKNQRSSPLGKLLKQLRLNYDDLCLSEQIQSRIVFPDVELLFSNQIEVLTESIRTHFPTQVSNWQKLVEDIRNFDELNLSERPFVSAKEVVRSYIKDPILLEMIFCPLMIYGSAWENDMEYSQFVVMFKSIFLQGFCRPLGGVRRLIDLLQKRFLEVGGELLMKHQVVKITAQAADRFEVFLKSGKIIFTNQILSSAGLIETMKLLNQDLDIDFLPGQMSFCESLSFWDPKDVPKSPYSKDTIIFYNNRPEYRYQKSQSNFDAESAVLCFPDNFNQQMGDNPDRLMRATFIANYNLWEAYQDRKDYISAKQVVADKAFDLFQKFYPGLDKQRRKFSDTFTPKTIKRYTSHINGAVYGSPTKLKTGKTPIPGLYISGTDQGFLGITGSILSGITVANQYFL